MTLEEIETLKAKFEKEREEFPIPSLSVRDYFDKMIDFCDLAKDGLKWRTPGLHKAGVLRTEIADDKFYLSDLEDASHD